MLILVLNGAANWPLVTVALSNDWTNSTPTLYMYT